MSLLTTAASLLGSMPIWVYATVALFGPLLAILLLRPHKQTLVLSSWPRPIWLYLQALLAISKKSGKSKDKLPGGKPIQVLLSRAVHFSAARLRRYLALAGFREGTAGAVPLMYPIVESFRLVMQCMLLPAFPFSVLGSVLGRTRVVMARRVGAEEKLLYSCRLEPVLRTTAKGDTEVDVVVEAHAVGSGAAGGATQLVWRSVTTAIILSPRRGRGAWGGKPEGKAPAGPTEGQAAEQPPAAGPTAPTPVTASRPTVVDTWRLGSDTGRRYGLLNGDLNPIHLYPATSCLFGFKRPIAHALFLTGRAEASLRNAGLQLRYPCALSAEFKRPTLLPATLHCAWMGTGGGGEVAKDPEAALSTPEGARFAVLTEDMSKEVLVGSISCHEGTVRELIGA